MMTTLMHWIENFNFTFIRSELVAHLVFNPTKLVFFGNEIFFHVLLLSSSVCNIWKKCIYYETAKLNSENRKTKKSEFDRIGSWSREYAYLISEQNFPPVPLWSL